MRRFTRPKKKPETVSLSKNHCKYPVSFPITSEIGEHQLSESTSIHGTALYNDEGEVTYAVSYPEGQRPITVFDRNLLMTLLACQQVELRKKKKSDSFTGRKEDYTLSFDSPNQLLDFIGLADNGENHSKLKDSFDKLVRINLHFTGNFHTGKKKISRGSAVIGLVDSMKYDWDEASANKMLIRMNADWVDMNEGYFLQHDLPAITSLSERAFNLMIMLEQWRRSMMLDGMVVKRSFDYMATRLGIKKSTRKSEAIRSIKKVVDQINIKSNNDYEVSFEKEVVLFSYQSTSY